MNKGKYTGHCQACGAQQVVNPIMIGLAKHGYRVAGFGYFRGICQGTTHDALELSRAYLDATVVALAEYAERADGAAASYLSGAREPSLVQKRSDTGNGLYAKDGMVRGKWTAGEALMVVWGEANAVERIKGLALAIEMEQAEARHARAHAKGLLELATRVHGQPLKARSFEKAVKVAPVRVDVAAVIASGTCASTFKTKAARKEALEGVSRKFDKLAQTIRDFHLAEPYGARSKESTELYFAIPHQLNNWRPKHAAATLALYPQAASVIEEIQKCVAAREAIKAAP